MGLKGYIICSLICLVVSCDCSYFGARNLGNGLALLEGDVVEDRVVIYCIGKSLGCCRSGVFIIPTYAEHMDTLGNYNEYVTNVSSNQDWIIIETFRKSDEISRFWIINKGFEIEDIQNDSAESIIRSHTIGPLDASGFETKRMELEIQL